MSYFARCDDSTFWQDKDRVSTLITLYEEKECLLNVKVTIMIPYFIHFYNKKYSKQPWRDVMPHNIIVTNWWMLNSIIPVDLFMVGANLTIE